MRHNYKNAKRPYRRLRFLSLGVLAVSFGAALAHDDYFRVTVLNGKTVVGVQHMPAWRDRLTQETIWAIKTYVDLRGEGRP